jgi:hypothetical protein
MMRELSTSFIPGIFLALCCLPLPHAQTPTNPPADPNTVRPLPTGQAPDEATKKITQLVHAGKYADAQKLTEGLLLAYPDDQRLIKAKALIDKMLAPGGSTESVPRSSESAQPATTANAERLSGMDKVDYNALIVLARQAQQTTDLDEQKKLLKQFMDQSNSFLQKHPDQELLWQLRATSAISLNDPMEGYDAGQKLLAAGAADSTDPALQQLLGQIKNRGWLDRQEVQKQDEKKHDYTQILGTWNAHFSWAEERGHEIQRGDFTAEFSQSGSEIQVSTLNSKGVKDKEPALRGAVLDSGEIVWERAWGSDWKEVSPVLGADHRIMTITFTENRRIGQNGLNMSGNLEKCTYTAVFTKK